MIHQPSHWLAHTATIRAVSLICACSAQADALSQAQELVTAKLKDPGSAQFRNVKQLREGVVCGEVNSKNTYGGYAGFSRFVVRPQSEFESVVIVQGQIPSIMTTAYPAEELGECFPELVPTLKVILGEDFDSTKTKEGQS